ncbi:uncharacterized protein RCH25_049783 [Pelodytes ibericus]
METKSRGTSFMSLDNREAKRVMEIYVKRSLSNCESKNKVRELREKKSKKVQRSISDMSRSALHGNRRTPKMEHLTKPECALTEKLAMTAENPTPEVSEDVKDGTLPTSSDNAICSETVKKTSWLKKILGQLFKKKDVKKEEKSMEHLTKSVPDMCKITEDPVVSVEEKGSHCQISKKTSLRKTSIKKTFSFKSKPSEEVNRSCLVTDACPCKPKRPTDLPLKRINRFSIGKADKKDTDCYYQKVSTEIELIVKESDKPNERKQSMGAESNCDASEEDPDALIKKIVSILRKQGDEWNSKIKEDPTVNSFFRNISYNSFKQLADVYVDKEIKYKVADATSEELKFAYSIHLTAQVAGLSCHPVNRIMGFGNRYLEDTLTRFSYGKKNWDSNVDTDTCISPD